ncbi:TFIIH/NER complex subunit TFB1 [Sugiyamaella lignohabitans]|uniref:TFIIH/NER complex subunit TFB1 n=1 Tax=Sugiyamaella lignohabitans TaxID=796027 RepID=A0A167EAL2_9ASCO|nr:TFIIH/NER complex subunit TFB1 [Sugiyamaella lignohabitans]ANB13841.1 TFIIH/NER complex subunit TFB1 [Sugiyamaella lignohabitans]
MSAGTTVSTTYPANFKKEPGTIEISDGDRDGNRLFVWKPNNTGSAKPPINIKLETVTQLQATPATSEKLHLKIICTVGDVSSATTPASGQTSQAPATPAAPGSETQSYVFAFKERSVMENTKTTIQKLVQAIRAAVTEKSANGTGQNGTSNGGANGTANNNNNNMNRPENKQAVVELDSKKLLLNLNLQQGLLRENKELMRTFQETVINGGLANDKFWNTRIHLLRAYALTSSQKRGAYNVLGTIRPTTGSDNQINVSLTREKIHDIFDQYPIVRQAYSDSVPGKMTEGSFWERFFLSRLFRRLRGEKVPQTHLVDAILDTKYLTLYEEEQEGYNNRILGIVSTTSTSSGSSITNNNSNNNINANNKRTREDDPISADNNDDNRPAGEVTDDMYHKIVPQYLDIGGNEENDPQKLGNLPDITMQPGKSDASSISLIRSMNSLSQRMLYGNATSRIISGRQEPASTEVSSLGDQLKFDDLESDSVADSNIELHLVNEPGISINGKSNSHEADDTTVIEQIRDRYSKSLQTGSSINLNDVGNNTEDLKAAVGQVTSIIELRSQESDQASNIWTSNEQDKRLLDQVQLCHATSVEFLRHFWLHFLSGDPNQASSISKLVTNLAKSLERIDAVSKAAPTPDAQNHARASLGPLKTSILTALDRYEKALEASSAEK